MKIFSLVGEVLLNESAATKGLDNIDKKASGVSKSMGISFGSIASAAAKVGAVIGVSMGFSSMITNAENAQKTMAQMDAVLSSTGGTAGMTKDQLIDLANAQSKVTTFSKGTTMAAENLLLTFTGISNKTFPDTIKAAQNMSQAMGTDLNSSVMTLGKALNNPSEGLSRLTKQGVTFTQEQKDQVKAMQEAGDTAGAQAIMLAELEREFGGSAEAAGGTFAGQLTILKNSLLGVGTSIGSTVLPFLQSFVTIVNENMPKVKQVITDALNMVIPKFTEMAGIIKDIVVEVFPSFNGSANSTKNSAGNLAKSGLNLVVDGLKWIRDNMPLVKAGLVAYTSAMLIYKGVVLASNIAETASKALKFANIALNGTEATTTGTLTVAKGIHTAATWAGVAATTALNAVMSMNPIALVIIAIGALIAAGVLLYNKCEGFRNFIDSMWDGIKSIFNSAADVIGGFFTSTIPSIFNSAVNFIGERINAIGNFFTVTIPNAIGSMVDGIENGFNSAVDFVASIPEKFIDGIRHLPGDLYDWGVDMISSMIDGIKSMIGNIGDAVSGVADKIRSFLHFSTPDEGPLADSDEYMPDFMTKLAGGIDKNKSLVTNAIKGLSADMALSTKLSFDTSSMTNNSNFAIPSNSNKDTKQKKGNIFNININIDKVQNNTDEDVNSLAERLASLTKQQMEAIGEYA